MQKRYYPIMFSEIQSLQKSYIFHLIDLEIHGYSQLLYLTSQKGGKIYICFEIHQITPVNHMSKSLFLKVRLSRLASFACANLHKTKWMKLTLLLNHLDKIPPPKIVQLKKYDCCDSKMHFQQQFYYKVSHQATFLKLWLTAYIAQGVGKLVTDQELLGHVVVLPVEKKIYLFTPFLSLMGTQSNFSSLHFIPTTTL